MNKLDLENMICENDTLVELSEECQFTLDAACSHCGGAPRNSWGGPWFFVCWG